MTACNYNPDATKDDGSCQPAKDGFDCKGNKLATGTNGATFFIRTQKPTQLVKSLSHAEVDLPENFEVGFEITPRKTPVKSWTNIIHFTATGKVCVGTVVTSYCLGTHAYQRYRICSLALMSGSFVQKTRTFLPAGNIEEDTGRSSHLSPNAYSLAFVVSH